MAKTDYSRLTIMFALPRSRTQWWAWFFQQAGIVSKHDPMSRFASPMQFANNTTYLLSTTEGRFFMCDTSAIFFHDQLLTMMPGVQTCYMFRNKDDVMTSLHKQTGHRLDKLIAAQSDRLFKQAYSRDRAVRLHWGCLTDDILRSMWTLVTGKPVPDYATLRKFHDTVIDVPLMEQYRDDEKAKSLWGYRE